MIIRSFRARSAGNVGAPVLALRVEEVVIMEPFAGVQNTSIEVGSLAAYEYGC